MLNYHRGWSIRCFALTGVSLLALCVGCNDGPATNPVSGKVIADGKPVEGGTLTFAPIVTGATAASPPVLAVVGADGTFTVKSGVITGKQSVSFSPASIPWEAPNWDGTGPRPVAPQSPWSGYKVAKPEIEVQAGKNDLTIELVK